MVANAIVLPACHGKSTLHQYQRPIIDLSEALLHIWFNFKSTRFNVVALNHLDLYDTEWIRYAQQRLPTNRVMYLVPTTSHARAYGLRVCGVIVLTLESLVDVIADKDHDKILEILKARTAALNTVGTITVVDNYKSVTTEVLRITQNALSA